MSLGQLQFGEETWQVLPENPKSVFISHGICAETSLDKTGVGGLVQRASLLLPPPPAIHRAFVS
jgi:hypothetical protein